MHHASWDPRSKDPYAAEHMDIDAQPPSLLPSISAPLDGDLCRPHRPPTSGQGVAPIPRVGFSDLSLEDKIWNPAHTHPSAASPLPTSSGRAPYFAPSSARGEIEWDRGLDHARSGGRGAHQQHHADDTAHTAPSLPFSPPHHAPAQQRPYQGRYHHQHHSPPLSPTRADRSCYPTAPSQTAMDHRPSDPSSSPLPNTRDRALPLLSMELKSVSGPHAHDPNQRSIPSRQLEHGSGSLIQSGPRPNNSAPTTAPAPLQQRRLSWEHGHDRRPDYYYAANATIRDGERENDRRVLHTSGRLRPIHHEQHPHYSQAQDQPYQQENARRHHSGSLDEESQRDEKPLDPAFPHHSSQESRAHLLPSHPHPPLHPKSYYTPPILPATSHLYSSANPYSSPSQQRIQQPQPSNSHSMRPRPSDRIVDGSTTQDSSYDSNIDDDEDAYHPSSKAPSSKDFQFKFGTDMPNTVDLRCAVECCEALCKFALHYSEQPSGHGPASTQGSSLEPNERANLQNIRKMNTRMLVGLHDAAESGEETLFKDSEELSRSEKSSLHLGPGPPSNEMVHEFAKAATSIFQLAVRIKAWVGKSPEERQVDEEINIIRAKRCLLMDSTLVVPTVDQHGNVQKDFVQASTSISKSFHERQKELEQQRQPPASQGSHKDKTIHNNHLPHTKYDQPQYPTSQDMDRDMDGQHHDKPMVGYIRRSHSSGGEARGRGRGRGGGAQGLDVYSEGPPPISSQQHRDRGSIDAGRSAFAESCLTNSKHHPPANYNNDRSRHGQDSHSVDHDHQSNSGGIYAGSSSRSSKNSDVPHQKYRKRAKRTQPPGRCLSCDSSDTPEWRRGPDGARTLCNACGLHYAKLLKRQSKQQQLPQNMPSQSSQLSLIGPPPGRGRPSSRSDQLQVITFPLRRPVSSLSSDPGSETMTSQRPNGSGSRPLDESPNGASKSPLMAQRAEDRGLDARENEDQVMETKDES
ncbi:hypothetical protein BGZ75_000628 [Mortierella antarctica]|nr:hypothetical protein BGZ75_000628 [Mortierella antarctica]